MFRKLRPDHDTIMNITVATTWADRPCAWGIKRAMSLMSATFCLVGRSLLPNSLVAWIAQLEFKKSVAQRWSADVDVARSGSQNIDGVADSHGSKMNSLWQVILTLFFLTWAFVYVGGCAYRALRPRAPGQGGCGGCGGCGSKGSARDLVQLARKSDS